MRIIGLCFLVAACGPKTKTAANSSEAKPAKTADALTVERPDGADAYAKLVIASGIRNWSPTGNSQFKWKQVTFVGDGTVSATALLRAGGEELDCSETGTWRIDQVETKTSGTLELVLAKTDCPSREDGHQQRIALTINPDGSQNVSAR
jgi:hypothetical protein